MLNPNKVKEDIAALWKATTTFMTKESATRMEEDVRKIRLEIADNSYEVQAAKDMVLKTEKQMMENTKELKNSIATIRDRSQKNEQASEGNKKLIVILDDRLKNLVKDAALTGGGGSGNNVVQEIEDNIQRL